jgi:hypothetical protein
MRKVIAPALGAVLAVLVIAAASDASFAQAGSTGGMIGKQDKSVSGSDQIPAPHSNTRSAKPDSAAASLSSPAMIHLDEHNATWGDFSISLKRTGSNIYEGVWSPGGTISRMTVTIGQESMAIERVDMSGGINLCHGHYSGTRIRGTTKASGEDTVACQIGGASSTWTASW